ncbi:hypothetical protein G3U99_14090 [Vibrio coralliilyticus OCN008]|uniref:hypothetical protein n=1 Tax=Vibrio coralliilyticus TaxID=190893 RepID=UPI0003918939|nr:hypothetical protein [Vibrio coralliilyticus]ERB62740.1 hypothetical protein N779_24640 [Vibrio coralliilyticus OCN008]QIJ85315.1 hypothetical protein G3U99_14090 [Vibrio coralliilyticus OCN008]
MLDIALIAVSALVLVNVAVTISLIKNDSITRPQKLTQVSIVWVVPFIGAVGFWLFHHIDGRSDVLNRRTFGGGANDSIGVSSQGD